MFNPLSPAQLVDSLSRVLRQSERWPRPLEPFQSGQLMSASSIGKYLSAELGQSGAALLSFRAGVRNALDEAIKVPAGHTQGRALADALAHCRQALETADDVSDLGQCISVLLADGRAAQDPAFAPLRAGLRGLLRDLVNTEVGILASAGRN